MSGKELARIGDIIDAEVDERDATIDDMKRQLARHQRELSDTRLELARAREDTQRALAALRRQLSPLYQALQRVFGELDAAGVADEPAASGASASTGGTPGAGGAPDARVKAVWDSWKSRVSPACGKVIDALLLHGELNSVQIKVAARLGASTVSDSVSKLNKAGLINKNGGRFSLKQL